MRHINGKYFREEIPQQFGLEFNQGLWHSGHVCPRAITDQILLVTLDKQGHVSDYRDVIDWENGFIRWSSQNSTSPSNKRGQQIINHVKEKRVIHLFVRNHKLKNGKAAKFTYLGHVRYVSHYGSKPMKVKFALTDAIGGSAADITE